MRRFLVFFIITLITLTACKAAPQTVTSTNSGLFNTSPASPSFHIEEFITNLDVPWEMAFAPDGRIFLTERTGKVRIITDGVLQTEPWITLNVAAVGEGGLLGLALDPGFTQNHYVYVAYTYDSGSGNLMNQLVRLKEDITSGIGILDKIIMDKAAGGSIHDGGRVKYGPDGNIYWTLGETGNASLAQDLTSLNGKILRVKPDGTVPPDNPFPDSFVYTYGNRNPEGLAWQPGTGRLYETEHGPSGGQYGGGQDEVNYIQPGKNYGWPLIHGNQTQPGMVGPVIQSGDNETWAPSGATFVSGGPWDGSFLYAGLAGQTLYRLVFDKSDPLKILSFDKLLVNQFGRLRDIVQGPDGALYILTNNTDGRGSPRSGDDKILKLSFN
jgi:glucose/arabinose dehydrogenase